MRCYWYPFSNFAGDYAGQKCEMKAIVLVTISNVMSFIKNPENTVFFYVLSKYHSFAASHQKIEQGFTPLSSSQ